MDDDYIRRGAFVLGIIALSTTDAHLHFVSECFLCTTEIKAPVDYVVCSRGLSTNLGHLKRNSAINMVIWGK